MPTHEGTPKKAKAPKSLNVEGKVRLIRWLVQTEPCVIPYMGIVEYAREDKVIQVYRPAKGMSGHRSGKWVTRLYTQIWAQGGENGTVVDKEFRRILEGCGTNGRGKNIKECAKHARITIDDFDLEGKRIFKATQDEEKKARKQLEENMEDDDTEDEDDETEEEIEGGSGKGSEEESGRINSGNDENCEEDGSLATDESETQNRNDGSGQEETNEEQVGNDDANDDDASSTEADNQNQANVTQIPKPKKRGRRSPGESSTSSSGGTAQVGRSGMSGLALKNRMKSSKKKLKTGNEQDGEQEFEQDVEQEGEQDGEQEAGDNSRL
ncbi:hypothetical protein BGAL_0002g00460 [Botrytis galanthina]|uniref:Uncharacterized protein n=1 Tax=Botrytis galanthina TaxID=278940 RepID=A0A4S8REJ2_9HELO|nr:hypothetical protein BGAL_0002g00460 [Botrytis galanthina]